MQRQTFKAVLALIVAEGFAEIEASGIQHTRCRSRHASPNPRSRSFDHLPGELMARILITGSTDGLGLMAAEPEIQNRLIDRCADLTGVMLPKS